MNGSNAASEFLWFYFDAGCLAEARLQIAFISMNVQLGIAEVQGGKGGCTPLRSSTISIIPNNLRFS